MSEQQEPFIDSTPAEKQRGFERALKMANETGCYPRAYQPLNESGRAVGPLYKMPPARGAKSRELSGKARKRARIEARKSAA